MTDQNIRNFLTATRRFLLEDGATRSASNPFPRTCPAGR